MVDAELDRAAQHGAGGVGVAGRAEHAGPASCIAPKPIAADLRVSEERVGHPADCRRPSRRRPPDPGTVLRNGVLSKTARSGR